MTVTPSRPPSRPRTYRSTRRPSHLPALCRALAPAGRPWLPLAVRSCHVVVRARLRQYAAGVARVPVQDRRTQLVEAAISRAVRDGLADTTVRGIAEEAGVSLSTVHYCFASKN